MEADMNILIVSGSPRRGGNTDIMAETFREEAAKNGHQAELISLSGKKIAPCLGCQYCFSHDGQCVQKDDMAQLLEMVDKADLLVLASPIYWFDVSAQLKCFIDRLYARGKKGFHHNQAALLLDSASPGVYDAAISQYKAICAYLKWEDKGIITIPGMKQKGDMAQNADLDKVRQLARGL